MSLYKINSNIFPKILMNKVVYINFLACLASVVFINFPALSDDATLHKYYNQRVIWGSCPKSISEDDIAARTVCGKVSVPIDYNNPNGAIAKLMVLRIKATEKRIGALLTNPGGPGGSGIEFGVNVLPKLADTLVGKKFDLIAFDPRGVGYSTPNIVCLTDKERDFERSFNDVDTTPAGIAAIEKREQKFNQKCLARSGINLLSHVGMREVAKDMDIIRAVLGDNKMNFLGYSYGTRLGAEYAEQFPTKVRTLILDGAVNPMENIIKSSMGQALGFQQAFNDFVADCVKKLLCPLGKDPNKALKKYQSLLFPLIKKPARTLHGDRSVSYADASLGVLALLYSSEAWKLLRIGLGELYVGLGDVLLAAADVYLGRHPDGSYDNTQDAFIAINCVDNEQIKNRKLVNKITALAEKIAPFMNGPNANGKSFLGNCAFWPIKNTSTPHFLHAPGLPKVVVVSTTHDPATPYKSGVALAKQLKARLVTFSGTQHTVAFDGNKCIDKALTDYLLTTKVPLAGLVCY